MVKRLLVAMILATTSVPLMAEPCLACSCLGRSSDQSKQGYREDQARRADAVFTGKVWRIEGSWGAPIKTHFFVEDAYKGTRRHRVTVTTDGASSCNYGFVEGKRYTVFGSGKGHKKFFTGWCTGTRRGPIDPDSYGL